MLRIKATAPLPVTLARHVTPFELSAMTDEQLEQPRGLSGHVLDMSGSPHLRLGVVHPYSHYY